VAAGPPHERKAEFEETALEYVTPLFNLALNLTRNRRDAEDLVQETYLRAYRFFDSYRPGTHMKAWLFRILRNTFINRYRAAKVRPTEVDFTKVEQSYERAIDEQFLTEHRQASPEEVVMNGVVDDEIEAAMAMLPEEYRSVVILALVDNLSYNEIASALSIPLGTVMSRLHRGRKLLQSQLLEYARRKGILKGPGPLKPEEDAAS